MGLWATFLGAWGSKGPGGAGRICVVEDGRATTWRRNNRQATENAFLGERSAGAGLSRRSRCPLGLEVPCPMRFGPTRIALSYPHGRRSPQAPQAAANAQAASGPASRCTPQAAASHRRQPPPQGYARAAAPKRRCPSCHAAVITELPFSCATAPVSCGTTRPLREVASGSAALAPRLRAVV